MGKTIEDNPILADYMKEMAEDVKITRGNIYEKSLMAPAIRNKWLNYFFVEKENLDKAKSIKELLLKKIRENTNVSSSVLRVKEEEKLMNSDPRFLELKRKTEIIKRNLEYLERALLNLDQLGYDIKNAIEQSKLERI